jgi:hypothetical protein
MDKRGYIADEEYKAADAIISIVKGMTNINFDRELFAANIAIHTKVNNLKEEIENLKGE